MYPTQTISDILTGFLNNIVNFLPQFFAGLIVIILGVIISKIISKVFLGLFKFFSADKFIKDKKFVQSLSIKAWLLLLAQILRWSVLILFLVAAVEIWGIQKVGDLLNQLLLYLPNVIVAVFIGFIGVVVGNLARDLVKNSAKELGSTSVTTLASLAYYSVLIFTILLVLNQLGVAADLIKIFFTGFVAMIALAGGLAFGLGGQEMAKKILKLIYDKINS